MQVCEECDNVRLVPETVQLEVDIEPGMAHGQVITIFEEGEPEADGDAGDLQFVVHVLPHPVFRREHSNLHTHVTLSLLEALTGFSQQLKHLDGHMVRTASVCVTLKKFFFFLSVISKSNGWTATIGQQEHRAKFADVVLLDESS